MQKDSTIYDSIKDRPLPKWLTDQKLGLTTVHAKKYEIKEDKSLNISFIITAMVILLLVAILSLYILRNHKNQSL